MQNEEIELDERPKSIAVLGAGPIGLEAALYGRFLGFDVQVFEQGSACEHVRQWSHVTLFTPFGMNSSRLGLAAIEAQFPDFEFLDQQSLHSGGEWIENYLVPLAQSDLLADNIHDHCRVVSVGRLGQLKKHNVGKPERGKSSFRIQLDRSGKESFEEYDFVIDATGTFGQPGFVGTGGLPALGELNLRSEAHQSGTVGPICHSIPDLEKNDVDGKHVLVLGRGYSAATNIVRLAELIESGAGTHCKVTWAVNSSTVDDGPIQRIESDSLPTRDQLAQQANRIAKENSAVELVAGTVRSMKKSENGAALTVELEGRDAREFECDLILANVGYRGDFEMLSELQLHRCYATDGPIKWAASLMSQTGPDCLVQSNDSVENLLTTEPGFFVLGSKLYGRDNRFLFSLGLNQIRDVYRLISGRQSQDLYSTIQLNSQTSVARS